MLADGILALEKIAEYAGLSVDEVKKLQTDKKCINSIISWEPFIGLPRWYLRLIMRYPFHNLLAGGHNLTFLFHKHQIAGN